MSRIRPQLIGFFASRLALAALLLFSACSINVKKEKGGHDKQVDISTPMGGIHVSKGADVAEVGLPVYPGAHLKQDNSDGDDKSANVHISGFGYSLRVIALQYQSNDPPAKIMAFYRDQLKKYGSVLECHTSHLDVDARIKGLDQSSDELTCQESHGTNVELKVGNKENQHIVAIEPDGSGSSFSLVYLRTHGKDAEI